MRLVEKTMKYFQLGYLCILIDIGKENYCVGNALEIGGLWFGFDVSVCMHVSLLSV